MSKITIKSPNGVVRRVDRIEWLTNLADWNPTSKKCLKRFMNSEVRIAKSAQFLRNKGIEFVDKAGRASDTVLPSRSSPKKLIYSYFVGTRLDIGYIEAQIALLPVLEREDARKEVKPNGKYASVYKEASKPLITARLVGYNM